MQNKNYKYKSDPYIELVIRTGVVIAQFYFILNIYTSLFSNMPDYKTDKIDAVNWIMPFNLIGLGLAFFSDRIQLPIVSKFQLVSMAISAFSRYIALLSGFLSIMTTIFFWFSEYRDILITKAIILFGSIIPAVLIITLIYLYYNKKLK
ncbi:MAG: hypothetical protein U0264_03345 [Candidatus Kapaibacterium sp.]